jgi:hypothetical protein
MLVRYWTSFSHIVIIIIIIIIIPIGGDSYRRAEISINENCFRMKKVIRFEIGLS